MTRQAVSIRNIMATAVALTAIAWLPAAEACDLRKITGRWVVQVIETDTVYPPEGGSHDETSHIVCKLRITREDAPDGGALVTATCSTGPYSSSSGFGPERFTLKHHLGRDRCEWSLASVLEPAGPGSALPGRPVNGTGDGGNRLMFDRDGRQFLGSGNLPLGIGPLIDPSSNNFLVTLIGMRR